MKKLKLNKKLFLAKEKIVNLDTSQQALMKGGSDTCDCPVLTPYQTLICPTVNPACNSMAQKATTCCGK